MSIQIALAGNPNCGKTTLFNQLTGATQYVGNWPGVTVEKKDGRLRGRPDVIIQDLPGVYSLSPYTLEEVVTRNYLVGEQPDVVLNVLDATNLERNLYLTTQLLELGLPVVIALNMMDVVRKSGDAIDAGKLSRELGVPVVPISALKSDGIGAAVDAAIDAAGSKPRTLSVFRGQVEHTLAHIEALLEPHLDDKPHLRWYAIKLFERDETLTLTLPEPVRAQIEAVTAQLERELDDDAESIITNERYAYTASIRDLCLKKAPRKDNLSVSDRIDRVVTSRIWGIPIFVGVMVLLYLIAVSTMGTVVTDFTNDTLFGAWIQPAVSAGLTAIGCADWLIGVIVDGIIGGVGAVLGFVPQMAILFFLLSILEDVGYLARVAFIMDRVFRRFGLSGKSFIPLLVGSGCGVPGIMATKTIENDNNRRLTIMTLTSIPCGAKLPVIALFAGIICGGAWWLAPLMYFIGIAVVLVSAVILKKFKPLREKAAPFLMELPAYHLPSPRGLGRHVWDRLKAFLKKAGTILLLACIVMWFLSTYGVENGAWCAVEDQSNSLIAIIGGAIAILFRPLGFGNWQAVAASISGFVAKEGIVTTIGVLAAGAELAESDAGLWAAAAAWFPSSLAAFSFLMFNLLDSPCLAAIAAMRSELGSRKWFWAALAWQNGFAYVLCLCVYQTGALITTGVFTAGSAVGIFFALVILLLMFRPVRDRESALEGRAGLGAAV